MKPMVILNGLFKSIFKRKALTAVLLMLFLMLFFNTSFYTSFNLLDLINSLSIYLILAFGITIVIISGGIDLSIGGIMALSGIIVIKLMAVFPVPLAIAVALLAGAVIGAVNGYLVVYQKSEPLIITLGIGMVLTGIAQQLTDAHPIGPDNLEFMMIANGKLFNIIPNLVLVMFVVFGIFFWILRYTQFGRNCYAIGGDYDVAKYSGINVQWIKTAAFVLCGMAAALGGVMLSSKLNSGSSVYGESSALTVISAVVVGGTSLAGGIGGVSQTAIGLLVFGVMENSMNMLGIGAYVQMVIRGGVIVTILCLDSYSRKIKREAV